jgi:acetyltransferase-like isoleucine patch superfamily enzyme
VKLGTILRRFLVPGWYVSLACMWRFGAQVSPKAEVELSDGLQLGKGTVVGSFTKIKAAGGTLRIGAQTRIATGCFLDAQAGGLEIGSGSLIGPHCVLVTSAYNFGTVGVPLEQQGSTSKGTWIGKNVFIGSNSVILDGSHIGDDVIITPCSVISGKIPPRVIVGGNPAKVIFERR